MWQVLYQALGAQRASTTDGISALRADGYLPNDHKITVVTRACKGKFTVTWQAVSGGLMWSKKLGGLP